MTSELVAGAGVATPHDSSGKCTVEKKVVASPFGSESFEKTEEESEGTKSDVYTVIGIELADLDQLAALLSFRHSACVGTSPYEEKVSSGPSPFRLYCVFLI